MTEPLKPCPFCGGRAREDGRDATMCENSRCGALIAHAVPWARAGEPRPARVDIDTWNRRAPRFTPEEREAMEHAVFLMQQVYNPKEEPEYSANLERWIYTLGRMIEEEK